MPQYFISVLHAPGAQAAGNVYADETAMNEAFAKVGAFNESLGNHLLFAGGLHAPEQAVVVETDGTRTQGPAAPDAPVQLGGFWIIEAADDDAAVATTTQAQAACGQRLEVRRIEG